MSSSSVRVDDPHVGLGVAAFVAVAALFALLSTRRLRTRRLRQMDVP